MPWAITMFKIKLLLETLLFYKILQHQVTKYTSVLNHSTFKFQDFSERAPGSRVYVQSTYF